MNWSQAIGIGRLLIPGIIGSLAMMGMISNNTATNLTAFALSILGSSIWSGISNTDKNIIHTASLVPGVETIKIDREVAAPAVQALANDASVPTVLPAGPLYSK